MGFAALNPSYESPRQRPRHRVWFLLDDLEQDARAALRLAAALLPIADGGDCKTIGLGECFLRQPELGPNLPHVDFFRDVNAVKAFVRAAVEIRLCAVEPRHDLVEGFLAHWVPRYVFRSAAVVILSRLRSAWLKFSFSFLANTARRNVGMSSPPNR